MTKILIAAGGIVVLLVVVGIVLFGNGGDPSEPEAILKKGDLPVPTGVLEKGQQARVEMKTSEGSFVISLDTKTAPKTTNSFAYLVEEGFYDGLGFHRIVPGFVIQGGDPKGDGTGGPGYAITERPPSTTRYTPATVAMAKSGTEPPGTSGSQFFIVTGDANAGLPPDYALVGKVTEGFDVVLQIGELGGPDEMPTRTVVIERATLDVG